MRGWQGIGEACPLEALVIPTVITILTTWEKFFCGFVAC